MNPPARRVTTTPARPTVHYGPVSELTPAERTELAAYRRHAAEVAARRERDRILRARWQQRQNAIAERDRRTRKVVLALAAIVGVGVLAGLCLAMWLIWHALTDINWAIVAPIALVGLAAVGLLGRAGHRCITVVQHWH